MERVVVTIIANNLTHSLRESILVRHNPRLSRLLIWNSFGIRIRFANRSGHGLVLTLET